MTIDELIDIGFVKHYINNNDYYYLYYFTYYNEGDSIIISTPPNSKIKNNNWIAKSSCSKILETSSEVRDYISQTLHDLYPDGY